MKILNITSQKATIRTPTRFNKRLLFKNVISAYNGYPIFSSSLRALDMITEKEDGGRPAPSTTLRANSSLIILEGECVSEFSIRPAPALIAALATCPLQKPCPGLADISSRVPLSAASSASSSVMRPGCAKMSAPDSMPALFVPGATGSVIVSPWMTTNAAPISLALKTSCSINSGGTWVSSIPGITLTD